MNVQGTIKLIGAEQQVTDKFKKREVVIITDDKYPQHISIEFMQDGCSLLDKYQIGNTVDIGINIRGREWINPKDGEVKHFNTINGWKIDLIGAPPVVPAPAHVPMIDDAPSDDLPF